MRKIITLLIPLSIILLSAAGCYTILKHPDVNENYTSTDYQQDCVSCHQDYHSYPYGYFYGTYPDYWWSSPRYGHYYAYPWWWDYYWYDSGNRSGQGDNNSDNNEIERPQGEKAVRRDALRPPYSGGPTRAIYHTGESAPRPADQTSTGSKPSTPDNNQKNADNGNKKTEEKKEEKKKAERREGGPR